MDQKRGRIPLFRRPVSPGRSTANVLMPGTIDPRRGPLSASCWASGVFIGMSGSHASLGRFVVVVEAALVLRHRGSVFI